MFKSQRSIFRTGFLLPSGQCSETVVFVHVSFDIILSVILFFTLFSSSYIFLLHLKHFLNGKKMNDLVDRIASGEATLLGIEQICARLDISRATFDRWLKNWNQQNGSLADRLGMAGTNAIGVGSGRRVPSLFPRDEANDSSMAFPPPDVRIGNSPKWELQTFKKWLRTNVRSGA